MNYHYCNIDHDRPLTNQGIKDSKKMGIFLKSKKSIPNLVLTSSALRAYSTATLAIKSGNWNSELIIEPKIYGGSPAILVNLINNQNDKYKNICLVGHEPNLSNFIAHSINKSYINFSEASMVKINFKVNKWVDIVFGFGNLDWHVKPDEIINKE